MLSILVFFHIFFFSKVWFGLLSFLLTQPLVFIIALMFVLFFASLFYYPVTCSIVFLLFEKEKEKLGVAVSILFLLLLNPVALAFYTGPPQFISIYFTPPVPTPCGIRIVNYSDTPNNPSRTAGIVIGERIVGIDDKKVLRHSQFDKVVKNLKPNQTVKVKTSEGKVYNITLAQHPQNPAQGYFGLVLEQAIC